MDRIAEYYYGLYMSGEWSFPDLLYAGGQMSRAQFDAMYHGHNPPEEPDPVSLPHVALAIAMIQAPSAVKH